MIKNKTVPVGAVILDVSADVYGEDALFMRAGLASADVGDGRAVEVWHTMSAAIGVTVKTEDVCRHYVISLKHLVAAALDAEDERDEPGGDK